jgi:hypothetical protein
MTTRLLVATLLLVGIPLHTTARGQGPDPKQPKAIDKATIDAWDKRGFEVGWMGMKQGSPVFAVDPKGLDGAVPAFRPKGRGPDGNLTDGGLSTLPPVGTPFGLSMFGSGLMDSELKELVKLKNLTALNLALNGGVTDAGMMKELVGLDGLTFLSLAESPVTDAGVKVAVAGLNGLTTLHLDGTQVTDVTLAALRKAGRLQALTHARGTDGKQASKAEDVVSLDLVQSRITDDGLKELAPLKNLTTLNLASQLKVRPPATGSGGSAPR